MDQLKVDAERAAFLRKLDKSDVEVTDWEARFIEVCMDKERFSPAQRDSVDRMIDKYASRVKW
jgi:hypothetical protein